MPPQWQNRDAENFGGTLQGEVRGPHSRADHAHFRSREYGPVVKLIFAAAEQHEPQLRHVRPGHVLIISYMRDEEID